MGQQQSKDELLYQQVSYGNAEGIKSLRREGAGLEVILLLFINHYFHNQINLTFFSILFNMSFLWLQWVDREGKTPLIVACMKPELYNVAKTLIELGANVNVFRPGEFWFFKKKKNSFWDLGFILFHLLLVEMIQVDYFLFWGLVVFC